MKCTRCGQEFEQPDFQTNICGNCADDLRSEEEAERDLLQRNLLQAEDEELARQQYEDAERRTHEQEEIVR